MTVTRRSFIALAALLTLGFAGGAQAKIVSTEEAMTVLVLGKADAPVEVVEYASLSCPACRRFHDEVYPVLKKEYIDTGKVKFVYHDFPTNTPGLAAAMIARCAGPERHQGMIDMFFNTQSQWGRAEDPLLALTQVARMAGIGPGEVDTCLKNTELRDAINKKAESAYKELGVNATPTVFVAGKKLEESSLEALKQAIDKALN